SFFAFLNSLHTNYAKISERGLHWTNLVADMMVPQRTSLFGLPLALMIFAVFAFVWQHWHEVDEDKKENTPRVLILMLVAGVLAGASRLAKILSCLSLAARDDLRSCDIAQPLR